METDINNTLASCVDAGGSAIGMPQLCAEWMPNQIFWLLVTLIAIFFILSRIALPRIGAVLAERSGTITNDIAAAEDLKNQAAAAEAAYEKALKDARAQAQAIIATAKAEIDAELARELEKAGAEIAARTAEGEAAIAAIRDNAIRNIAEVATDTAGALVTAFGGSADTADLRDAVASRLKG